MQRRCKEGVRNNEHALDRNSSTNIRALYNRFSLLVFFCLLHRGTFLSCKPYLFCRPPSSTSTSTSTTTTTTTTTTTSSAAAIKKWHQRCISTPSATATTAATAIVPKSNTSSSSSPATAVSCSSWHRCSILMAAASPVPASGRYSR